MLHLEERKNWQQAQALLDRTQSALRVPCCEGLCVLLRGWVESLPHRGLLGRILAAVGSRTTAGMTSAAICAPIMAQLGLTPLATFLLCGAGTMCFSHLNDSGFWVAISFYGFTVKQNLKCCTIIGTISGVVIFVMCATLSMLGVI